MPYLYRGRFRQDQVLFACVDAALVGSWRRPVGELRQLIDTIGKVLDYPFNDEAVGAAINTTQSAKVPGRPHVLDPDDLAPKENWAQFAFATLQPSKGYAVIQEAGGFQIPRSCIIAICLLITSRL